MQNDKIRYFSMFTGVGGFELGLTNSNQFNTGTQSDNERLLNSTSECNGNGWRSCSNGFECIGFSEIDKYANQLLANKFPSVRNYGDATKINASELPDFDMLCGGFPCQSFSIAGKRRGFEDTRGTMFFHIARILEVKRPKIVFLENVKGLLNHDEGKTFRVIIQTLSELGYNVQWMVLNSKFHGVPQNRERVFIIGSLRGQPRPEILPFREINESFNEQLKQEEFQAIDVYNKKMRNEIPTLFDPCHNSIRIAQQGSQAQRVFDVEGLAPTLRGLGGGQGAKTGLYAIPVQLANKNRGKKPYNPDNREMKIDISKDENSYTVKQAAHEFMVAIPVLTPDREEKRQNGRRFKEDGEDSFTLTKTDIHGVSNGMKIRRLTPTECERLQGFPDGWTSGFSDTQRYKMMGNAVTTKVISAIANGLVVFSVPSEQKEKN
jgi:DNA (cytosine-5)-methyltransferase 1